MITTTYEPANRPPSKRKAQVQHQKEFHKLKKKLQRYDNIEVKYQGIIDEGDLNAEHIHGHTAVSLYGDVTTKHIQQLTENWWQHGFQHVVPVHDGIASYIAAHNMEYGENSYKLMSRPVMGVSEVIYYGTQLGLMVRDHNIDWIRTTRPKIVLKTPEGKHSTIVLDKTLSRHMLEALNSAAGTEVYSVDYHAMHAKYVHQINNMAPVDWSTAEPRIVNDGKDYIQRKRSLKLGKKLSKEYNR